MNNAKMWLVVKPTVGIPLFLTGVAVSSFAVHVAVLSKTNWYSNYLVGTLGTYTASVEVPATTQNASLTTPAPAVGQAVLVVLPDGSTARAILQPPVTLAAADGRLPVQVDQ
ncbi:MAG: light-harvesting protein [Rhodobacteraceae bacterium]|nr:light-harvesting protein [Paracoccaceae bacterium]